MIEVKNMRDYTERVWFLGTEVLLNEDGITDSGDFQLMDDDALVYSCDPKHDPMHPGVFYRIPPDDDYFEAFRLEALTKGYSKRFVEIVGEAHKRGYLWIYFHPDIETKDVSETDELDMTVEELKNKYGGSVWDEHPDYDREDWQDECENDDVSVGYWTWVKSQIELGDD